ncbi:MAG: hypothetical protein M3410_04895 [Acidobacteriota bacterium]|nr:hypothetical protein [Acidobacteriota bacterium]
MTAEEYAEQVKTELTDTWLPLIYAERILKARTRWYYLGAPPRKQRLEIHQTLLGVELKMGQRRLLCPDLATARYLAVFARAGCREVAIPYDITRVSLLADELESSWHRMLLLTDHKAADRTEAFRARIRGLLIAKLRSEVAASGAGASVPRFKQSTKAAGRGPLDQ